MESLDSRDFLIKPMSIPVDSDSTSADKALLGEDNKPGANGLYVRQHTQRAGTSSKSVSDFILWSPDSEIFVKWKSILEDPLAAKNTYNLGKVPSSYKFSTPNTKSTPDTTNTQAYFFPSGVNICT